jgi:hypothetical protein
MTRKLTAILKASLWLALGMIFLVTATGCGSPYSPNDSERPWNEPKGFQFKTGDRDDR